MSEQNKELTTEEEETITRKEPLRTDEEQASTEKQETELKEKSPTKGINLNKIKINLNISITPKSKNVKSKDVNVPFESPQVTISRHERKVMDTIALQNTIIAYQSKQANISKNLNEIHTLECKKKKLQLEIKQSNEYISLSKEAISKIYLFDKSILI